VLSSEITLSSAIITGIVLSSVIVAAFCLGIIGFRYVLVKDNEGSRGANQHEQVELVPLWKEVKNSKSLGNRLYISTMHLLTATHSNK